MTCWRSPAILCTSTPDTYCPHGHACVYEGVTGTMSVSVSMPQLGESVTEGTVTRWLKKEGERVEADEALLEGATDKVDTEIPSPAAGVLREIAVGEDETVEVGAQLAVIEEGADASGGGAPSGDAGQPAQAQQAAQEQA